MTVLAMNPEEPQRSRSTRSTPERCNRLCGIVEEASTILRGVSTVVRGASEIRERYTKMHLEALALIEEMRTQAED